MRKRADAQLHVRYSALKMIGDWQAILTSGFMTLDREGHLQAPRMKNAALGTRFSLHDVMQ